MTIRSHAEPRGEDGVSRAEDVLGSADFRKLRLHPEFQRERVQLPVAEYVAQFDYDGRLTAGAAAISEIFGTRYSAAHSEVFWNACLASPVVGNAGRASSFAPRSKEACTC